jgi:hypothetical protein
MIKGMGVFLDALKARTTPAKLLSSVTAKAE